MLLGEYSYSDPPSLLLASRYLIAAGLILVVGIFLYYLLQLSRLTTLTKNSFSLTVCIILLLSNLAIIYFVNNAPYTCDADFRYQYPALPFIGYAIGRGLSCFPRSKALNALFSLGVLSYLFMSLNLIVVAGRDAFNH